MRKLSDQETDNLISKIENLCGALDYVVNSEQDESYNNLETLKIMLEEVERRLNQGSHTYVVNVDGRAWY